MFWLPRQWDLRSRGGCFEVSFVGPVVQSARFGEPESCQNWSKSFWRHSPVLVFVDARRKRIKVGFRGRSSSLDDLAFVASLLCMTGAALSSVLVEPSAHFRTLGGSNRSRCGARRILSVRSEPSAHFGRVKSLSLWRGAHFEHAKWALFALWVG